MNFFIIIRKKKWVRGSRENGNVFPADSKKKRVQKIKFMKLGLASVS